MSKTRIEWIDFLKGLAIVSVVMLHACGGTDKYQIFLKWITSFHMFLFFHYQDIGLVKSCHHFQTLLVKN